ELLLDWSRSEIVTSDDALKEMLGQQLLRLVLSAGVSGTTEKTALETASVLLAADPKLTLTRALLHPDREEVHLPDDVPENGLARLWQAAQKLTPGISENE